MASSKVYIFWIRNFLNFKFSNTYNLPLKNYILWWKSTQSEVVHRAQVPPSELSFILNNLCNDLFSKFNY